MDLYTATRSSISETFGSPAPVANVNSEAHEDAPYLTDDELGLYFYRSEGPWGLMDIWHVERNSTEEDFGEPVKLPPPINSEISDFGVAISGNELYFGRFDESRNSGDLFVSTIIPEPGTLLFLAPTLLGLSRFILKRRGSGYNTGYLR
jgi:hypothetical protein